MDMISLSEKLNELDLQYPVKIPKELIKQAKDSNLVIVYCGDDGQMVFDGAITDEVYAYTEATSAVSESGLIKNECADAACPYFAERIGSNHKLEASWGGLCFRWMIWATKCQ